MFRTHNDKRPSTNPSRCAHNEPRQPPKHREPTKNDTLTTLVCNVQRSKIRSREAPADLLECHSRSTALVQVRRFASLHIDKTKNMKVVVMGDDGWSESRIRTYSVRTEGGMCRKISSLDRWLFGVAHSRRLSHKKRRCRTITSSLFFL